MGGSAGSLGPIKLFLAGMPADSGAAFVVIQHLAPSHTSMLTEILAQHTPMQIFDVREGMPVEPNCVYIIPPNRYLGIRDGVLYLADPVTVHGIRMPIDFFSRSLAEDRQERAIFILFSGAGSDGTLGVRAVRGAGGLTIAQDQTAQFADMPRSAIATGMVDIVLSPDRMPKAVMDYLRQPYIQRGESAAVLLAEAKPGGFNDILHIVKAQTDHDFRCYKKSTILRRIERRMGLHGISDFSEYGKLLRWNADEIGQLNKDLLINVTSFFRDAEAFEELRRMVIAPLVQSKQTEDKLRVWVPGCSSGEEAYSLAMLLSEEMEATRKQCAVQILSTDIDEEALQLARSGIYPESIAADVGSDRLSKFFERKDSGYKVIDSLRNSVIFAVQNFITDPPFSRMDIVSCRNLMIYIDADTQAKLIPLFNYALSPGGYLFLGKSEGIGGRQDLFDMVSKKNRLYRRITPARPIILDSPILPGKKRAAYIDVPAGRNLPATAYPDSIRHALLNHFAASVVLVDRKGQILQFHGQTSKYLNLPTGEPSLNLLDIAKEGLSLKLRSAMHRAASEGKAVVLENVRITQDESSSFVRVTVKPILPRSDAEPLLAAIFEDIPRPVTVQIEAVQDGGSETAVMQLEDELRASRQALQSTIEDLQTSNEEMRVSNEEVVSTNEELQSTNEELETSKEELQSVNEELITVNSQLQEKIANLNKANNDISNFLSSTQIATLFLDSELRIKLFTPAANKVMKVIPSDAGRPISDLSLSFIDYDLPADIRAVARDANTIEREVRHSDGSSYLIRIIPYYTQRDRVDGIVLTFGDVTKLRRAERQTRLLATVVTDSNEAVVLFDLQGNIQDWNSGAQSMYGWSKEEALRLNIHDIAPAAKAKEDFNLMHQLQAGKKIASFETQRLTKDGRVLDVWLTATPIVEAMGSVESFAFTERDITERKRSEESIKQLNETLEHRVAERTAEAERYAEQLRKLTFELTLTEQREQRRLAQILHDGLQQILVVAKIELAFLERRLDMPNGSSKVADLINEAIETSRSLTSELSPPVLHQFGLLAGLNWLAGWVQLKYGLTVSISVPEPIESLPENVTILLFHATRELLFNVVKHAGVKTARIDVTKPEGQIQLSVEDEGAGFDTSRLQAAGDLQGIGLFSMRERIRMLGGRMEIDSSPGRGSRFKLAIPYAAFAVGALHPAEKTRTSVVLKPRHKAKKHDVEKKIRVLLADDHPVMRQGLAGLLGLEKDIEVIAEAQDGETAIRLARELRPDVVLMDVSMPGMDGIQTTRIIHSELPDIHVIGLSMFHQGEQAAAMREAGAVNYLPKSGPPNAVADAIRACMLIQ